MVSLLLNGYVLLEGARNQCSDLCSTLSNKDGGHIYKHGAVALHETETTANCLRVSLKSMYLDRQLMCLFYTVFLSPKVLVPDRPICYNRKYLVRCNIST